MRPPDGQGVRQRERYQYLAASIGIALDEAVRTGRVQPGMTILLVAFGAGFTWAAMAVRW
jgi:3-oxoacyl-[acyl-carrier-protein] synthase-3